MDIDKYRCMCLYIWRVVGAEQCFVPVDHALLHPPALPSSMAIVPMTVAFTKVISTSTGRQAAGSVCLSMCKAAPLQPAASR